MAMVEPNANDGHALPSAERATGGNTAGKPKRRPGLRRLMWEIPLLLVLLVACVWTFGALFGRHLFLYFPTKLTEEEIFAAAASIPGWRVDVANIRNDDDRALVGLVRPGAPGKPWLLYFGGNAQSLRSSQDVMHRVVDGTEWGAAVWGYRGYDATPGVPTERNLIADGKALVQVLADSYGVRPSRVVVVGQSLGTGIATQVARAMAERGNPAAGLVLVSPYRSIPAVGNFHFVWPLGHAMPDKYDNFAHLPHTEAPLLILHGADDAVVPHAHGEALHALAGGRSDLTSLPNIGHNDVWSDPAAVQAVRRFVDRVASD